MPKTDLIVVPDGTGVAGLIVWWELGGYVDCDDLTDVWVAKGFSSASLPSKPTEGAAIVRAANFSLRGSRQLCRPLRRGAVEIVWEDVHLALDGTVEHLSYTSMVRCESKKGESPRVDILGVPTEAKEQVRAAVISAYRFFLNNLVPSDISAWLLKMLSSAEFNAVPMRSRGGFYFVPESKVEKWRDVVSCMEAVGRVSFFEIPAMRTDAAVNAILTMVNRTAETQLRKMAEYLKGDVSTKGLNATVREAKRVKDMLDNYVATLGVDLDGMKQWCEQITGAVQAAQIVKQDSDGS